MWFKVVTYCPLGTQQVSDPACQKKGARAWFYSQVLVAKKIAAAFGTRWPSHCLSVVPCTFWERLGSGPCPKIYFGPECHADLVVVLPQLSDRGYAWRALYRYPDKPGPVAPFLGWVYTNYEGMAAIESGDIAGNAAASPLRAAYQVKTQGNALV